LPRCAARKASLTSRRRSNTPVGGLDRHAIWRFVFEAMPGRRREDDAIYRVRFDGSIGDEAGFCAIAGTAETESVLLMT